MKKILVIGSLNMDLVINSPRCPQAGETLMGEGFFTNPGGKGANQAVAAARLNSKVAMIGCIGKDSFGKELLENLNANKIDVSGIKTLESIPTGVAVIVVSQNNNRIIVNSGANFKLTKNRILESENLFSNVSMIVMQLEIPLETVSWIINTAWEKNIPVLLNPAPAVELDREWYKKINYLTPNETECEILLGKTIKSLEEAKAALSQFQDLGIQNIIITLGQNGVVFNKGQELCHCPAKKVKAMDTTAAGDAFSGALAVAISEGKAIDEAVEFAVNVSALAVTKTGAQSSLPFRHEVENFMKSN